MTKSFPLFVVAGLVVVGGLVWFGFFTTRGAHLELKGEILKVRVLGVGEKAALVVVDFRVTNTSDYPFMVRTVDVAIEKPNGENVETTAVARRDMDRVFQSLKLVGPKFNEMLTLRDRIAAHQTMDRMTAVRVELAEAQVEARRRLRLRIEDTDGTVAELVDKK